MSPASTGTATSREDNNIVSQPADDVISSSDLFAMLMRVTDGWLDCVSTVRSELPLAYRQQGGRGYAFALRQLHASLSGEQNQRLRRAMDKVSLVNLMH